MNDKVKATEAAKKITADGNEARAAQNAQRAALAKSKPTPTQEENDVACSGGFPELEDDGSGPDPGVQKQVEGGKSGAYTTRQATPQAHAPRKSSE